MYFSFHHFPSCKIHSNIFARNHVQKRFEWTAAWTVFGTALSGAATSLTLGFGGYKSKMIQQEKLYDTYKTNIFKTLQKPFVPPFNPKYGPVFERKDWERQFRHAYNSEMYYIYYGAGQLGKSLAIIHSLKERKGVIYCRLQETVNATVVYRFASAIGFTGPLVPAEKLHYDIVLSAFHDACKRYTQETGQKVIMIIEDLHLSLNRTRDQKHLAASQLAADLVRIHNDGFLNVVYTTSDYKGVRLLQQVSGHSQLTSFPFPKIPDDEFKDQLFNRLVLKKDTASKNPELVMRDTFDDSIHSRVFKAKQDVDYIVDRLDSHMGDTTSCLRQVIEYGVPVKDAVDSVVRQSVDPVVTALLGLPEARRSLDQASFVAVSSTLFEGLTQRDEVAYPSLVAEKLPKIPKDVVDSIAKQLVELNLLGFVDSYKVSFHARRIKWAYEEAKKIKDVSDRISEAMAKFAKGLTNAVK